MPTGIEYCDETWEIGAGCSPISESCENCWACRLAATRLKHHPRYRDLAEMVDGKPRWTGEVRVFPEMLEQPRRWRQPRTILVGSRFDLFHSAVRLPFIRSVFCTIRDCPLHTFLVLTKRVYNMRTILDLIGFIPTSNLWLGITAENQARLDERWEMLRPIPGNKWLSVEPLLGPVDVRPALAEGIGAVIVGGESGPGARAMNPDWVRAIRDQCAAADVPFFLKQWGEWRQVDSWRERVTNQSGHRYDYREVFVDGVRRNAYDKDLLWLGANIGDAPHVRVGKKAAGRLLDGREHNDLPWRVKR